MAQLKSTNITGNLAVTGNTLASKIIKLGGTDTEILLANGDTLNVPAAGLGTVTSVGISVPTGLTVSNSPITSTGTINIAFTNGYSIPTTAKQTNWDTAYGWGDHSTVGYLTAEDQGAGNGLDADKLDGQHGDHYLNYDNFTNTPTIPVDYVKVVIATSTSTTSGTLSPEDLAALKANQHKTVLVWAGFYCFAENLSSSTTWYYSANPTFDTASVDKKVITITTSSGAWRYDNYTYKDSDTKNTAGSTNSDKKLFLVGAESQAANPQTYSDSEVYTTNGTLTTNKVQVGNGTSTIQYNTTEGCLEFVFA